MNKTNAMRLLEQGRVPFTAREYQCDEDKDYGRHVAAAIGMPEEQVFKTLVGRGEKLGVLVFCVPVAAELDLKKAARAAGDKKVELVAVKELFGLTGYVRGGCTPVGMKKPYPVFLEETAMLYDAIAVSGGARGLQMVLNPGDLASFTHATVADLV